MSDVQGDGAAGLPARRISDDERRRVVDRLRDAAGLGALTLDELEDRIGAVYDAKTVFDLEPITADLPATRTTETPAVRVTHRRPLVMEDDEFRSHFTTYCLVIGMLVVIWLASGAGHPWPIYPAAGWGIGLGSHYQVAATHQRKRLARARSLGISLDELEVRETAEKKARREARKKSRDRVVRQARELAGEHTRRAQEQARKAQEMGPPCLPWLPTPPGVRRPRQSSSGASPAAPGPRAEPNGSSRRFVAAMFVDVVGSTGLNEALGDDGWVRVRERLRAMLRECFEREGGWEVSSAGDGVLARFDHPNAAACAAVEVMRRLSSQREETGFAPSVRVGIHSGDVVEDGDDIIGSVVNLASRVTGAGEPDQIMVTEHVADHLDSSLHTEDLGIHSLRGISRPRHLLAVRWR